MKIADTKNIWNQKNKMIHPIETRYGSDKIRAIFDEENRLELQLKVEAALVESLAELGQIPKETAGEISKKANTQFVKLERVKQIEEETRHDIMALVKALSEVSGEAGKYVHLTATSYDIVDMAQALQIKDAMAVLFEKGKELLKNALAVAGKYENLTQVGRTHGQHAIPITFGFKFANYADKIGDDLERIKNDRKYICGKFSGAVGNYAAQKIYGLGQELEQKIMAKLGIEAADISTQVVARENLARIVCDIAILASTIEQIAKEIRNLQRTEIAEISEPFGKNQVGSSTMAQKKNPINSENICGNARVIRSCVAPTLENIALEHERDLTNSSAERSILPTVFILADDVLIRMNKILQDIAVFPENMSQNLSFTKGAIMAEAMIMRLVQKGMGRQTAHEILRQSSFKATELNCRLEDILVSDQKILKYFSTQEIKDNLQYESYIGHSCEKTRQIINKWKKWNQ